MVQLLYKTISDFLDELNNNVFSRGLNRGINSVEFGFHDKISRVFWFVLRWET